MSFRNNSVYRGTMVHNMFVNWLLRIKISFSYCNDCIKYVRCRLHVQIFTEPVLQLILIMTLGFGLTHHLGWGLEWLVQGWLAMECGKWVIATLIELVCHRYNLKELDYSWHHFIPVYGHSLDFPRLSVCSGLSVLPETSPPPFHWGSQPLPPTR